MTVVDKKEARRSKNTSQMVNTQVTGTWSDTTGTALHRAAGVTRHQIRIELYLMDKDRKEWRQGSNSPGKLHRSLVISFFRLYFFFFSHKRKKKKKPEQRQDEALRKTISHRLASSSCTWAGRGFSRRKASSCASQRWRAQAWASYVSPSLAAWSADQQPQQPL